MDGRVLPHVRGDGKSLSADVTHVRSGAVVYSAMYREMGGLGEGLATHSTTIGLQPKVNVHMVLQLHPGTELLGTVITGESAISLLLDNVHRLLGQDQSCCLLAMHFTAVLAQLLQAVEGPATVVTAEVSQEMTVLGQVFLHAAGGSAGLATQRACEGGDKSRAGGGAAGRSQGSR